MGLLLLALAPWLGALLVACVPGRRADAWVAGLTALAVLAGALVASPAVFDGEVLRVSLPWLPSLGLDFGLRMDGLVTSEQASEFPDETPESCEIDCVLGPCRKRPTTPW